ncbi:MAG TPA: hypothetical protein DCQ31_02545 [Bacteroidales bacterium]|nr:hypothetical protein [Bacteroidales bacterium]
MKTNTLKNIFFIFCWLGFQYSYAQAGKGTNFEKVNRFSLSSEAVYKLYPPENKAFGPKSDSLLLITGIEHLYYNGSYYSTKNFADYFKWYVDKHWHLFEDNTQFDYYYLTKNYEAMFTWLEQNLQPAEKPKE